MPELAELAHMADLINQCREHAFHAWKRSDVSGKLGPDLPLPQCWSQYQLSATSRGKELMLTITPLVVDPVLRKTEETAREEDEKKKHLSAIQHGSEDGGNAAATAAKTVTVTSTRARKRKRDDKTKASDGSDDAQTPAGRITHTSPSTVQSAGVVRLHPPNPLVPLDGPLYLLFRCGMSGRIAHSAPDALHKHDHLTFFSTHPSPLALSFRDMRRFGRWLVCTAGDQWDKTRGPCPYKEYELFRANILDNLHRREFARPLCEMMLNQAFFNGIGNYLRAEIILRADVDPFASARSVIGSLAANASASEDVLSLCHTVVSEAYELGSHYGTLGLDSAENDANARSVRTKFSQWRQAYKQRDRGIVSTRDRLGRTLWHHSKYSLAGSTATSKQRADESDSDDDEPAEGERPALRKARSRGGARSAAAGDDESVTVAVTTLPAKSRRRIPATGTIEAGKKPRKRAKNAAPVAGPASKQAEGLRRSARLQRPS